MKISRRSFVEGIGALTAAIATNGLAESSGCCRRAKIGLQLYSIRPYIEGVFDSDKKLVKKGVGLGKALAEIASIGYKGVEFAGTGGKKASDLKALLSANGLTACGAHMHNKAFGFDTAAWKYDPERLKRTLDFELAYGNALAICPGGGNLPEKDRRKDGKFVDEFIKRLVDLYNKAADDAGRLGCRIGIHNHVDEFRLKTLDGTAYWDYFFSNTDKRICMEQDVGWATCVGVDPKVQYRKYPHRSPTLHAKENAKAGLGTYDAILGKPSEGVVGVDWDELIPVTESDGVAWYVVECEKHREDLSAVTPSYAFLKSKGLN